MFGNLIGIEEEDGEKRLVIFSAEDRSEETHITNENEFRSFVSTLKEVGAELGWSEQPMSELSSG